MTWLESPATRWLLPQDPYWRLVVEYVLAPALCVLLAVVAAWALTRAAWALWRLHRVPGLPRPTARDLLLSAAEDGGLSPAEAEVLINTAVMQCCACIRQGLTPGKDRTTLPLRRVEVPGEH